MYIRNYMVILWPNIEYGPLSSVPHKFEITVILLFVYSNIRHVCSCRNIEYSDTIYRYIRFFGWWYRIPIFSVLPIFDITCCCLIVTSNIRYFSAVEKIEFCEFIAKLDYLCTLNSNLGVLFSNLATNCYGAKISNIDEPPDTKNP